MAEVEDSGDLRGMVSVPQIEIPRADVTELGVGKAIGDGLFRVWREGESFSYESQVEIKSGGIGSAVAHFLEQSEQTRSAVLLGVLAEREGLSSVGGIIIEALPGSEDQALSEFESHLTQLPSVSRLLATEGLDGLVDEVLKPAGYRITETRSLQYRCRCSERAIRRFVADLSDSERGKLRAEDRGYEAECVFCGRRYSFDDLNLASQAPSTGE
jgi:molecular chaperone Hsp33